MKKALSIILALCMVFALCAVCASAEEPLYFSLMAKGFQHQYWQAVYTGAKDAAAELGVDIYFDGPASETDISGQVNMFNNELAKRPAAFGLAALSPEALYESLYKCAELNIPVICFDSGVPNDPTGAVKATVGTDNESAAALAAEKFGEQEDLVEAMKAATVENPVIIACMAQDATAATQIGRAKGFVDKMKEVASQYGVVSVEGHDVWADPADNATIIIDVQVPATTEATDCQNTANALLAKENLKAFFLCNEGVVTGFLAATSDGEDLGEGGKFDGLYVAGFDAGTAQKNAIRNQWFLGSVSQNPYMIGYKVVYMCNAAANGEEVEDLDSGAVWYDYTNIDDPDIAILAYD